MSEENRRDDEITGRAYDARLMKRLLKYVKPYSRWVLLAIILTIVVALLSTVRPYLTKIAVDDYIFSGDKAGLRNMVILIFAILLFQGALQYLMTYLTQWIGQKVIFDLRMQLFEHIQKLSMNFFDKNPVGRIVTRLTNDTEVLNEMFSSGLVMVFADVFIILGILFFMLNMSWQLTLISLSVIIPLIIATAIFRKKVRAAFRDVRFYLAKMNTYLQEHVSGIMTVKIFSQEARTKQRFSEINRQHTDANIRSVFYYSVFFPVVELIGAISGALIIWYGGGEVIRGALTIGVLISFIQYSEMFFRPIRDLSEKYNILQTAMASSERIFSLLDTKPTVTDHPSAVNITGIGKIEFRNVWFAYKEDNYILKNISFNINKGEKVALVGATGAGKTSVINLICRFYDAQKGEILIDGINIKNISQNSLRKHIGLVLQDVFLFSGSVKDNILLNNDQISDDSFYESAGAVGIEEFVNRLPEKFYQNVKERGIILSHGQRQLITFARALAYDPDLLILDEATSSVDTKSEMMIRDAIDKLMEGRTSIVIAHRLSTIRKCDKIIVMHKGEIREYGTHDELLSLGGIYTKLYQLQYKESLI